MYINMFMLVKYFDVIGDLIFFEMYGNKELSVLSFFYFKIIFKVNVLYFICFRFYNIINIFF